MRVYECVWESQNMAEKYRDVCGGQDMACVCMIIYTVMKPIFLFSKHIFTTRVLRKFFQI